MRLFSRKRPVSSEVGAVAQPGSITNGTTEVVQSEVAAVSHDGSDEHRSAEEVIARLQSALSAGETFHLRLVLLGRVVKERLWATALDAAGNPFETFADFTLHPLPEGLGISRESSARMIESALCNLGLVEAWIELLERIVAQPGRPRKNPTNGAIIRFYPMPRSPNARNKILLRLKHERRDLFDNVIQNTMTPHQAAIQAGWCPPPAPPSRLATWLHPDSIERLNLDQRLTILREIYGSLDLHGRELARQQIFGAHTDARHQIQSDTCVGTNKN